jgi:hypothetical protein
MARKRQEVLNARGLVLSMGLALLCAAGCRGTVSPSADSQTGKRLIQMSGAIPILDVAVANRAALEQGPYDGTFVALKAGRRVFLRTERLTDPASANALKDDEANISKVNSAKLTDNFLVIRGGAQAAANSDGTFDPATDFDPFDDGQWQVADDNIRTIARIAKLGALKGIAFDTDSYTGNSLFSYTTASSTTPQHTFNHTFAECQDQLRQRGRQFMSAVQEEYPGSRVFLFGGMSMLSQFLGRVHQTPAEVGTLSTDPSAFNYNLFPAFLNGMLEVIEPGMELIDGCEAYYYTYQDAEFGYGHDLVQQYALALVDPSLQQRYRDQMKIAFSVYVNASFAYTNPAWNLAQYLPVALLPQYFEYQVFSGLNATDRYLWIYWESSEPWPGSLPNGAEAALADAKVKVAAGRPLGLDIEPQIEAAARAHGFRWR